MELFEQAPSLNAKLVRGRKMRITRKVVGGVTIRLGHAGSPTSLKSEPIGLSIVDEYADMKVRLKGQTSDPLTLAELRGESYPDFVTVVTSTPSEGVVGTRVDEKTGLEFWDGKPKDVICPQFSIFLEGTRFHFCWLCKFCHKYFVPRFKQLRWPKGASPFQALQSSWVQCPHCNGKHYEADKAQLNRTALFVAPGQTIQPAKGWNQGIVIGEPPDSITDSYWTSGLCSPFRSFGERAALWLQAAGSGDLEQARDTINGAFAELWAPGGGESPSVTEVKACCLPYKLGELPAGIRRITCGVDVQKDRLIIVTRGWGARGESWLIHHFELWARSEAGELSTTEHHEVWNDLSDYLDESISGRRINLCVIDSGFRPGKASAGAEHPVYEFCRRHQRHTRPAKGSSTALTTPMVVRKHEVTPQGKLAPYSVQLLRLNTDYFKTFVMEKIRWPQDQPGSWHLPEDISEDYINQLISEARVHTATGRPKWVQIAPDNHTLDCEAMNAAAAYLMNVNRIPPRRPVAFRPDQGLKTTDESRAGKQPPAPVMRHKGRKRSSRSAWLSR